MDQQTPTQEGVPTPTPNAGMSPEDSAKATETTTEAKPAELQFAEKVLGREFSTVDEAEKAIANMKSFVGDQTLSKQRTALDKIATQAGLTRDELVNYMESQELPEPQEQVEETPRTPESPVMNFPDDTTKRVLHLETDAFIKENPDANAIRDILFAKALATRRPVKDVWEAEYAPIIEVGRKLGSKKLQASIEGQPIKATSVASDTSDTKVDFTGVNPATGKRWTSREMESYLGYTTPSIGL